jgi:hypothetical protein
MKYSPRQFAALLLPMLLLVGTVQTRAIGDEHQISLADGKLVLQGPKSWQVKRPSSGIVDFEFAIPKSEGDETDGRMTVMGAGGSIDANVDRWLGQFRDADGKPLGKGTAKTNKRKIGGMDVVVVDIAGTYIDKPGGPFAPGPSVERENYRMLAAIVQTKNAGNYFFKFYGPKKTVADNEKAFLEMLETLTSK